MKLKESKGMTCRRLLAMVCVLVLAVCVCPLSVAADEADTGTTNTIGAIQEQFVGDRLPYMSEVLGETDFVQGSDTIALKPEQATATGKVTLQTGIHGDARQALLSDEMAGDLSWSFTLKQAGWYMVKVEYTVQGSTGSSGVRGLKLDGKRPYFETDTISFDRSFRNDGEPKVNSVGDEVRPSSVEIAGWSETYLYDQNGFYVTPLLFPMEAGEHTLTLTYLSQTMMLGTVTIEPYVPTKSYKEVLSTYPTTEKGQGVLTFQAEDNVAFTSDPTIRMQSDGDPAVEPAANGYRVYNAFGGSAWKQGNQTINYTFTVPETGLYRIALRVIQSWNDGIPSHRRIAIDGEIPFKELESVRFNYDTRWQTITLGDGKDDFWFYLEKGEHTLTMSVTLGTVTEIVQTLYDDMTLLSDMLLEITKLTGSEPDPNYDYQFFKFIPTLENDLKTLINDIQAQYDKLYAISGKNTSMGSNLISIVKQLQGMLDDPFTIAKRFNQLTQAQTSLGQWYQDMQSQPLLMDEFMVVGDGVPVPVRVSTFWQRMKSTWSNFLLSFKKDYNNMGSMLDEGTEIKETINVWIARGTEWAEVIKEMADSEFTTKSGIAVNVNVVPAGQLSAGSSNMLMLSITSGTAPDAVLGIPAGSPVEFAIRDAVVDMKQFKDFDQISGRFLKETFTPLEYQGGVYGLPETMIFTCLFYRKDVLQEYNIAIPDTRQQLYDKTLPQLFENGLTYYQTPDFTQFLYQHGGSYYTEDGYYSALDSTEAFRAFKEYTEMYTHYSSPVSANFFNRFRSGEMPIGIGNYALYLQLCTAAPELVGKWAIAPLPGVKQADGEVNRATAGIVSEVDMILAQDSDQKYEECWEFLKWWSDEDVQRAYAKELEAMVGVEARWNTANTNAFLSLDWNKSDLGVIQEMWDWARETPVILGSAYAGRHITNAYTNVVVSGSMTVRDALENAVKNINRELRTKQEEYGIFVDEIKKGR